MSNIKGKISQVIGPVVDVKFEKDVVLPSIYDALVVLKADGTKVVLEVQSHVGENAVRTISMDSTDGFTRGMEVLSTGTGIKMPIGEKIKGRLFNVVGEAIDGINEVDNLTVILGKAKVKKHQISIFQQFRTSTIEK